MTFARCSFLVCLAAAIVSAVTSPYPFRSGYGLGSWIEPAVIEGMKQEAAVRSMITMADRMQNDAESVAREIQLAGHPTEGKLSKQQTIPRALDDVAFAKSMTEVTEVRKQIWDIKLASYYSLWDLQRKQIAELHAASKGKIDADTMTAPTTFASAVMSPINWALTEIVYKDRGFDAITVDATFVKVDASVQRSDSSAHSRKVSASVSASANDYFGQGASLGASMAAQAGSKTSKTSESHQIEYTMILMAMATHRKVKQFQSVVVDVDKMRESWNYYQGKDNYIIDPNNNFYAFYAQYIKVSQQFNKAGGSPDPKRPKVSLVTEAFLGSALLGMVHFIQQDDTTASQSNSMSSSAVAAQVQVSQWLASATGSTSASQAASRQIANSQSQSNLDVRFDIVSMGYIPTLKSSEITQAIKQFGEFDPSSMGVNSLPSSTAEASGAAQNAQQSNTGSIIDATIKGLKESTTTAKILDLDTFMNAFDDYTNAAKTTEFIGVPVGLNVEQFDQMAIMNLLADKYLKGGRAGGQKAAGSSGDGSSTTSTQ